MAGHVWAFSCPGLQRKVVRAVERPFQARVEALELYVKEMHRIMRLSKVTQ